MRLILALLLVGLGLVVLALQRHGREVDAREGASSPSAAEDAPATAPGSSPGPGRDWATLTLGVPSGQPPLEGAAPPADGAPEGSPLPLQDPPEEALRMSPPAPGSSLERTHEVQRGETFSQICDTAYPYSDRPEISLKEVMRWVGQANSMREDQFGDLRAGQKLLLPPLPW